MTLLAVADDKFLPGLEADGFAYKKIGEGKNRRKQQVSYVPVSYTVTAVDRVMTDTYDTDAHFVSYTVRRGGAPLRFQPRVNKAGLPVMRAAGFALTLNVLVADIDLPGHAKWSSDEAARAEVMRVSALLGTCGVYATSGGLRVVQPLSRGVPIEESEDAERVLRVWLAQLEARGLTPDWSCTDWTRHMRAPNVRRDRRDYRSPLVLLERMVHVDAPAGLAVTRSRKKTSRAGSPIDVQAFARNVSEAHAPLVEQLARPLSGYANAAGERHRISLALAGALLFRRVPPEQVPALGRDACLAGGFPRDRADEWFESGVDTVRRWAQRQPVAGLSALPESVRAVLEVATDARRADLAAQVQEPAPLPPVAEVTRGLEETIRSAPEGLTVIQAGCGAGKTRAASVVAIERAQRRGERKLNTKTGLVVPFHDLAQQVAANIEAEGEPVRRLFGPLSVKGPYDGYECRYRACGAALAEGGQSVRKLFCGTCDYREECTAVDGASGPEDARIIVGPHALLSEVDGETGKTGLLYIDEPPAVLEDEALPLDDLILAERHLGEHFDRRYAAAMAPALQAVRAWVEHGELEQPGPLARAFDYGLDPDLEAKAFDATGILGARELVDASMRDGLTAPPIDRRSVAIARSNLSLAQRLGRTSRVLRAIRRGLLRDGVTATLYDRTGRLLVLTGVWLPLERALLRDGRVVVGAADAGLYLDAYERVVGYRPAFHEFRAGDGAPVSRTLLLTAAATRRGWTDAGSLDAAVRAVVGWAREAPIEALGVVTFQRVEARVRTALREALPDVRVEVAHFGAVRGLDAWKEFDALATLGDPWPNLDHVARELGGVTDEARTARAEDRARAELEQAHGRLRVVHRTRPARALHVGSLLPAGWHEPIDIRRPPAGRPRRAEVPELAALVEAAGGARAVARAVGRSHTTVNRWLSGEGRPSPADLDALRAAGSFGRRPEGEGAGGTVTPRIESYTSPYRSTPSAANDTLPEDGPEDDGGGVPPSRTTREPRRPLRAPALALAAPSLALLGAAA